MTFAPSIAAALMLLLFGLFAGCAHPAPPAALVPSAPPPPHDHVRVVYDRLEIDQSIHFESGSDQIKANSFAILDEIVATLQRADDIHTIQVLGHTDAQGQPEHNLALSQRRAAAVVRYLQDHGVAQRLSAEGFGSEQPVCRSDTDECRSQNRRVEFVIVR